MRESSSRLAREARTRNSRSTRILCETSEFFVKALDSNFAEASWLCPSWWSSIPRSTTSFHEVRAHPPASAAVSVTSLPCTQFSSARLRYSGKANFKPKTTIIKLEDLTTVRKSALARVTIARSPKRQPFLVSMRLFL